MRCLAWLIASHSEGEPAFPSEVDGLPSDLSEAQLDFAEREIRTAQAREDDRERGVQARLIALLGLASLVTAVLSGTAALATAIDLEVTPLQLVLLLVALSYIAVQALAAMLFTIKGLMPRSYPVVQPWGETQWDRHAVLSRHVTNLKQSMWATNLRIDDMVLALGSLKRFAWGSATLLLVLLIVIVDQRFGVVLQVLEFLEGVSKR